MILKSILKKGSIEEKLIYSNTLTLTFAICIITVIMLVYQYVAIKDTTLQEIRTQTDIIRDSVAAAVAFQDPKAAQEVLFSLKSVHHIIEAYLLLPDNKILASYYGNGIEEKKQLIDSLGQSQETITWGTIIITKPIILRSEIVGTIYLVGSLHGFHTRLSWYITSTLFATIIALILGRLLAIHISKSITEPLSHLISTTKRITTDNDYSADLHIQASQDEVGDLSIAFKEMMSQIKKRDLSLQQLAYYDRVTHLHNRHSFEERITQAIENAKKYGTSCYLMMIDLDDFKIVNDTLGHAMGDLLLQHIGERLMQTLRNSDTIFRIGGDEFAVIIESTPDDTSVQHIAHKIINAISEPLMLEKNCVKVGASIGISHYPLFANNKQELISTADIAMYTAKSKGKNSFEIYT